MPVFRFAKEIPIKPQSSVFLSVEVGATRTPPPNTKNPDTPRKKRQQRKNRPETIPDGEALTARGLPDFLIIGAQKSGTTFLYDLLGGHPNVEPAAVKEVQYFTSNFERGEGWYRAHFPSRLGEQGSITGEASPYYLFHPHAPARAARLVPEARLVVVLRDPVDRAYSHYHHIFRRGREPLGFDTAVRMEPFRLRGETEKMREDERYHSLNHQWFSYLSRGVYVDQLSAWLQHFDRDRMLILKSGDLFADTPKTMKSVLSFLGLPDVPLEGPARAKSDKGYAPMEPDVRRRLEEYFEPHNHLLSERFGVDFGARS